jgi:hypothetical protein
MDRTRSPCDVGRFFTRQPGSFLTVDSLQSDWRDFLRTGRVAHENKGDFPSDMLLGNSFASDWEMSRL